MLVGGAEVAEWQTRRSQKPLTFTGHVGSTPTFGTNSEPESPVFELIASCFPDFNWLRSTECQGGTGYRGLSNWAEASSVLHGWLSRAIPTRRVARAPPASELLKANALQR